MNLLHAFPFTLMTREGTQERVAFTQIADPRFVDLIAPRADFRGAGYQFAVGVLQLAFAPEDEGEWREYWNTPPDAKALADALAPLLPAFELDSGKADFMQDWDLPEAEQKDIAGLLIDAPGEKTIRDNLDHFVKRGSVQAMCPACAAAALFTLQINAPSGGVGHRVSLRGGGPLTTLVLPNDPAESLWRKLWLNVLPADRIAAKKPAKLSDVLPWMAPTRTSEAKGGVMTTPETVHPLQAYWSMPRRIRLSFPDVGADAGACDVCGEHSDQLLRTYRARNYGVNYAGDWLHPLTPYTIDPKKPPPLSIKGQRGGVGYRHWLGFTLGTPDNRPAPATVVRNFYAHRSRVGASRLWCFGYDMDNMKARCWYDSTLPVHTVPPENQAAFAAAVAQMMAVADEAASLLRKHVKAAHTDRPQDREIDPMVGQSFWQETEAPFYAALQRLSVLPSHEDTHVAQVYRYWLLATRRACLSLFDTWVQGVHIENLNTRRVVEARADLLKWLNLGKVARPLWKIVNAQQKESA